MGIPLISKSYSSLTYSLVCCLTSAFLYILAFPNFGQWSLAWVALVPLASLAFQSSPRDVFRWGWLSGTLAYIGILYWIVITFRAAHLSIFLSIPCLLLLAGYLGLYWGVWAWFIASVIHHAFWRPATTGLARIHPSLLGERRPHFLAICAGAAAWVALEYLRTYLFSGFPWALLGDSQVLALPLIQIASLTGVYGVSFLAALTNLTVADLSVTEHKMAFATVLPALLLISGSYLFGQYRLHHAFGTESPRPVKVALLQGSIDQYKKWDKAYVDDIQQIYEKLVAKAKMSAPDMIIWPETSVPGYLLQEPPLAAWLMKTVQNSGTSHLVGAPAIHHEKAYNSSFSINREGGIEGEYAKRHLVPFGEVVPWSGFLGKFIRVLNDLGGFTAGTGSAVVPVAGYPVGVNICYEALFPNLVRESVKGGAVLIANLTNDGWYMKTSAPYQHWAPNIFRAVENDRWLLRADNTGVTGIIAPSGRVLASSPLFQPCVVLGTVEARKGLTFYSRFGDVFAWACILFCALIFVRDILRE